MSSRISQFKREVHEKRSPPSKAELAAFIAKYARQEALACFYALTAGAEVWDPQDVVCFWDIRDISDKTKAIGADQYGRLYFADVLIDSHWLFFDLTAGDQVRVYCDYGLQQPVLVASSIPELIQRIDNDWETVYYPPLPTESTPEA